MKRYLLFAWAAYDAGSCGWAGFKDSYDSDIEAMAAAQALLKDYSELAEIIDTKIEDVIWDGERSLGNRPGLESGLLIWRKP